MAESRRATTTAEEDKAAQKRRDNMFRVIFFIGLAGLVVLMILIAKFLSGS